MSLVFCNQSVIRTNKSLHCDAKAYMTFLFYLDSSVFFPPRVNVNISKFKIHFYRGVINASFCFFLVNFVGISIDKPFSCLIQKQKDKTKYCMLYFLLHTSNKKRRWIIRPAWKDFLTLFSFAEVNSRVNVLTVVYNS